MSLLLHACCADCTLKFVTSLKEQDEVSVFYCNPNIHPRSEYQARLKAIQQICEQEKVKLIIPDWSPKEYFKAIKSTKIGGRCADCWNLRLVETAKYAHKNGFSHFSSTLVTSEYQDREKIMKIAKFVEKKYKVAFLMPETVCSDLKTSGFYKQFFCGCVYSLTERFEEKYKQGGSKTEV